MDRATREGRTPTGAVGAVRPARAAGPASATGLTRTTGPARAAAPTGTPGPTGPAAPPDPPAPAGPARAAAPADAAGTVGVAGPVAAAAAWSRRVLVAGLVGFACLALLTGGAPAPVVLAVAAAGLVAGLPHGAVDHLLLSRLGGHPLAAVAVAYAAAATAAWALLYWAGPLAQWGVIALSVVHFGLGETEVWRETSGWHPPPATTAVLALAGSGALLLPLARAGDELGDVAAAFSPAVAGAIAAAPVRAGLAVLWGAAALVSVLAALRAGRPRIAGDVLLIGAVGALLPPLAAFALWFGGWHAVRHTGRLLAVEPGCATLAATGRTGSAARRLARLAALPTAVALVAVLVLVGLTVAAPAPEAALAEVLRILLALTVPHMLAVLWLDRRRAGPDLSDRRARRARRAAPA
ncbi:MAG TPA: beta-carotene 15,15'-dioxygenase, Brp/Blh family [Pseudonocardia sp.]|nr:beta-carotene 15,15'-dioxygenase, Brp/Blh family [Pseudonocardia sp.]